MEDTILMPGYEEDEEIQEEIDKHLQIDNFLSEYDTPGKKAVIRENLNVYSKDDIYSKDELDTHVAESVNKIVTRHTNLKDPHKTISQVKILLYDYLKQGDPFIKPQVGVDPVSDNHLATKGYVDSVLNEHLSDDDAHFVRDTVNSTLKNHPFFSEVYTKNLVYNKKEINNILSKYLKITKNTKPIVGVDPVQEDHLATKRYVDKLLYQHLIDTEAHKAPTEDKVVNTYTKQEVYTKKEVEELVSKVVSNALTNTVDKFKDSLNKKMDSCKKELAKCIKKAEFENYITANEVEQILDDNIKIILNELNGVQEGTGFGINGTYEADLETHYLQDTTSILEALKVLDLKIYELLN